MNNKLYEDLAVQFYIGNTNHRHYDNLFKGLEEEVNEVLDAVTDRDVIQKSEVIEELGDVLWYITVIANTMGVNLETLMTQNYYKLERRQLVGKQQ